ncbi:hypothetical protein M404DRAFT_1008119, partial [Pisolithus tinctorius Marx 270]
TKNARQSPHTRTPRTPSDSKHTPPPQTQTDTHVPYPPFARLSHEVEKPYLESKPHTPAESHEQGSMSPEHIPSPRADQTS